MTEKNLSFALTHNENQFNDNLTQCAKHPIP